MHHRFALLVAVTLLTACGGSSSADAGGSDGGSMDAAGVDAHADSPGADGCTTDADGDGHAAISCGGDDCDDTDPHRYPGNLEVCDPTGRDEDCNPATLGPDADGDGFVSVGCCDRQPSGLLLCGTDCDDTRATVNPTAVETCNLIDDNCDGMVDNGAGQLPDCDHDGFGDPHGTRSATCMPSGAPTCPGGGGVWASTSGDCDDANPVVFPGAPEACDGIDNDCNGTVDGAPAEAWCNETTRLASMHATSATCGTAGACTATCASPYLDCTSATGCETDGHADVANCGACAHTCSWSCVSSSCDEAVELAASPRHTCVRRASGHVDCWGANDVGQLGDGTTTNSLTPIAVAGLADAVEIAAGGWGDPFTGHTCARRASGAVVCWGENSGGQLGDGTMTDRHTPTPVSGLTDAVEISVSEDKTCARRASGAIVCWGLNLYGELGDGVATHSTCAVPGEGSLDCSPTPVTVSGLTDAVEIAVGGAHTCARRSSGSVACWGSNFSGELGDGTTTSRPIPIDVVGVADAVEIAAGDYHTCARRSSGAVTCWGQNLYGQIGDGSTANNRPTPVAVVGVADAVEISADGGHSCARRVSGAVALWGSDLAGELMAPVAVVGITDAVEISAGGEALMAHTCARRAGGQVVCWGVNNWGQVGDGTNTDRYVPTPVVLPP